MTFPCIIFPSFFTIYFTIEPSIFWGIDKLLNKQTDTETSNGMLRSAVLYENIPLFWAQEENKGIIIISEGRNGSSVFSSTVILAPEDLNLSPHLTGWPKCREGAIAPPHRQLFPTHPVIASPVCLALLQTREALQFIKNWPRNSCPLQGRAFTACHCRHLIHFRKKEDTITYLTHTETNGSVPKSL